ncbi:DUF2382 domain-containing protein [Nonomuraea sp. NPDC050478]|uniref:DUF2382 domain-containing protein n=1 Tax=unclassified Nonomuraea TaxID=2593643 RepID=UPI0011CD99BB|nr:PRC and DUF2382 domain-containing protein [Nonomuraea sp. C10]TXK41308.1 DUF2382 domain-containing protein [Nonomuraea sp. C10]
MQTEIRSLFDCDVIDSDGQRVGRVGQVYLSDRTGDPEWVTVRTGMFGMKQNFVPLTGSRRSGNELRVPFVKEIIKGAPSIDVDEHLTLEEEAGLYRYYGMQPSTIPSQRKPEGTTGTTTGTTGTSGTTAGMTGKVTGPAPERRGARGTERDVDMTRSEETMHVGKETREAGHVRLRKYVDSENVQESIPLEHDEVVIEREPISGGQPLEGRELEEDEESITLYEERPVVGKETRPVERVRLHKERVRKDETVQGEVRKERFEVDRDGATIDERDERDDRRGR